MKGEQTAEGMAVGIKKFLSHLSGDEEDWAAFAEGYNFLSHLSGDEVSKPCM